MKKILHVILISLFSLTVISCAKKDDSTTTSSGLFVAVGNSGTLLTSSDGTSWTSRTSGSSETLWNIFY
ncbi:MAG: cell wall-binding protein, partial [Candidatus Poseidoniia archaeon]|nr:cell wall-binding protein [Candidatus Poseidoniia archaeon]